MSALFPDLGRLSRRGFLSMCGENKAPQHLQVSEWVRGPSASPKGPPLWLQSGWDPQMECETPHSGESGFRRDTGYRGLGQRACSWRRRALPGWPRDREPDPTGPTATSWAGSGLGAHGVPTGHLRLREGKCPPRDTQPAGEGEPLCQVTFWVQQVWDRPRGSLPWEVQVHPERGHRRGRRPGSTGFLGV